MLHTSLSFSLPQTTANPKSQRRHALPSNSTLAGLISRWATPRVCRYPSAKATCAVTTAASLSLMASLLLRSLAICMFRVPPAQYTRTAWVAPCGLSYSVSNVAMFAWPSLWEMSRRTSSSRWCSSACLPTQLANVLMATSFQSLCLARTMVENAPAAIGPSTLKPNLCRSFSTLPYLSFG